MTSTDGMTADFYPFDMKFLGHVATRIINEVKGVNRVVYDVTQQAAGHDRVGVMPPRAVPSPAVITVIYISANSANPLNSL